MTFTFNHARCVSPILGCFAATRRVGGGWLGGQIQPIFDCTLTWSLFRPCGTDRRGVASVQLQISPTPSPDSPSVLTQKRETVDTPGRKESAVRLGNLF